MGFCCSKDGRAIVTGFSIPLNIPPRPDSLPKAPSPHVSNPVLLIDQSKGDDKPDDKPDDNPQSTAPVKLDLTQDSPDLILKYEQLIQEKRDVVSSCSIVTVHRFGSPLSYVKESENSFESGVSGKDQGLGSVLKRLESPSNDSREEGR